MALKLATTARDAGCNGIVDLIDDGTGAGMIRIYNGTQPSNPQTAHGSTLLATLPFSATAFGASSSGQASAAPITSDASVLASLTAQWARVLNGDGVDPGDAVMDMDIGEQTGTLDFDDTTFIEGGTAAITSFDVTVPQE